MIPLPDKKYSIIYADPPWSYQNRGTRAAASKHYDTMTIEDIKRMGVGAAGGIANEDCVLFMWATFPMLREALDVIEAWGFSYKTVAFNWVKQNRNGTVEVMTTYLSDFSRNTLYRAKADAPGLRTGFRGREVALIELRSLCIPNEGTAYLLDLLSRMTNENSVSTNDNGVTQTVEARQGVALNALVEIKPRVMLRPFRTFLEVEQPESEFLLRVDPDEGISFFEADGGIWKLEAKKNIADYFLKNMGDLIDAGKVVVMQ